MGFNRVKPELVENELSVQECFSKTSKIPSQVMLVQSFIIVIKTCYDFMAWFYRHL